MSARLLIVDDEPSIRTVLATQLRRLGHTVTLAADAEHAVQSLTDHPVDVVISDLKMPGMDGLALMRWVHATRPHVPFVLMTAFGTVELAVEALKCGAFDFITKPFDLAELRAIVEKAIATHRQLVEQPDISDESRWAVDTPSMRSVWAVAQKVAQSPAPILISGEPGTGKELLARAIHRLSRRAEQPFITVHLRTLAPDRFLQELFGWVTPEGRTHPGRLSLADGGTILLDEVDTLPPEAQVRLLSLLREPQITPVGAHDAQPLDVRIIASTSTDLTQGVKRGSFRDDLYYKLAIIPLAIPPLRDRPADIPVLVAHILARARARLGASVHHLTPEAQAWLAQYAWPGNLRELETMLERATLLTESETLDIGDLQISAAVVPLSPADPAGTALDPNRDLTLKDYMKIQIERIERHKIIDALQEHGGNVTHASKSLGISRRSLQMKMKEYGLRED